jgi:hypothetical protein
MATDALGEALLSARKILVDLGRHLDNAAEDRDLAQVGRAWVRAAQLERVLRGALPAEVTAEERGAVDAAAPGASSTADPAR